jgi:hypothetical protein
MTRPANGNLDDGTDSLGDSVSVDASRLTMGGRRQPNGLRGEPAPVTFSVADGPSGSYSLFVAPLRVADIAAQIVTHGQPTVIVFNVDHYEFDADNTLVDLAEIAAIAGVSAVRYQTDWAERYYGGRFGRYPTLSALAFASTDLERFLEDLYHYDLDLMDAPEPPSVERFDQFLLNWNTTDDRGLDAAPDARFHIYAHDDCFLRVDCRDPTLRVDVVRAGIASRAGASLLRSATDTVTVSLPPPTLAEQLLETASEWTSCSTPGRSSNADDNVPVELPFAAQPWRIPEPPPGDPSFNVTYHPSDGSWHVGAAI